MSKQAAYWLAATVGAFLFVGGFIFGGLVYESHPRPSSENRRILIYWYQTLIGGVFALVGAWVAWAAINRQIAADDRRRAEEIVSDRVAVADAITALLMLGSTSLKHEPDNGLDAYVGPTCLNLLVDAMRIETRLGVPLGAFIRAADDIQQLHADVTIDEEQRARFHAMAYLLAFRSHVLAEAFQIASQDLARFGSVRNDPIMSEEHINALREEHGLPSGAAAGWVRIVSQAREL